MKKKGAVLRTQWLSGISSLRERYYPICIDWNSGPFSTYAEHLFLVRQGIRQPILGPLTSPIVLATDLARGVSRAPLVWGSLLSSTAQQPGGPFYPPTGMFASHEALKEMRRTCSSGPIVTEKTVREADCRTPLQSAVPSIHNLFFAPKAVTAMLIDIIGTGAWDMMLRRSEELFHSPTQYADLSPEDAGRIGAIDGVVDRKANRTSEGLKTIRTKLAELNNGQGASSLSRSSPGAVEQFLAVLEKQLGPDCSKYYSITIVGHSMGAIVANEMLVSHPKLPFDEIVYMAAACSVGECTQSVGPYLEANPNAKFYNLTLHPTAEVAESNPSLPLEEASVGDWLLGGLGLLVPRGSLLVWLDEFFTKPVTLEQRRMGKWSTAVTEANLFPADVQNRVYLKMFRAGPAEDPQKHGSFASEGLGFWNKDFRMP